MPDSPAKKTSAIQKIFPCCASASTDASTPPSSPKPKEIKAGLKKDLAGTIVVSKYRVIVLLRSSLMYSISFDTLEKMASEYDSSNEYASFRRKLKPVKEMQESGQSNPPQGMGVYSFQKSEDRDAFCKAVREKYSNTIFLFFQGKGLALNDVGYIWMTSSNFAEAATTGNQAVVISQVNAILGPANISRHLVVQQPLSTANLITERIVRHVALLRGEAPVLSKRDLETARFRFDLYRLEVP